MTDIGSMTTEEALAHYGVKGMKWGKRRSNRISRLERVASGTGNRRDKAVVGLTEVSAANARKNGGLKGGAARKVANMEARDIRISKGQATTKDILARYGGDRIIDTGRPDKGKTGNQGARIAQLERVAAGKGSKADKAKVALAEVSASNSRKNGGLKGGAANKAANMKAREKRIAKGEAKATDILARLGGDRIIDTGRPDSGGSKRPARVAKRATNRAHNARNAAK